MNVIEHIEDAIDFLVDNDVEHLNKDFIYQTEYFNSEDYNGTLLAIEKHLNSLYEKSRVLQDVIQHTKEYVKQNIYTISDECKNILDEIEDNVDSLKNMNYISINVSFEESTGAYLDRDGKPLAKAAIYDRCVTLSNKNKSTLKIKTISRINNFKPYRENINNLKNNSEYRAYYILDAPINNGLKEQIKIEFENEKPINQLDIITSNCKASDVNYINSIGTTVYLKDHINIIQDTKNVKSLNFLTTTESYKKLTYYIDESRITSNFWDSISEHEYKKSTTGKGTLTQAKIDEMAGLAAFKKEYEAYTKAIEDWIARRTAVANTNMSNGYSDSVPKVDFIVAPKDIIEGKGTLNTEQISNHDTVQHSYQTGLVLHPNTNKFPDVFPDTEKAYYQNISDDQIYYIDKTGKKVEYLTSIGQSAKYTKSIETK